MASNQNKNSLVVKKSSGSKKKIIFNDLEKYENAVQNEENKIQNSVERIHDIEEELRKLRLLEKELEKEEKKKKATPKKTIEIPVDQKHTIVPVSDFEGPYNYDKRRKEWHAKAGHNETQLVCDKCKDDDNWATILLDDGRHICYYCWVRKPKTKVATKKKTTVKTTKKSAEPKMAIDYEVIYPIELETLRAAFEVLPKNTRDEYEKKIYKMIDRLIEKKFIEKRH